MTPTILIVEDEDEIRLMMRFMLGGWGECRVVEAATAGEGLEVIRRDPPDLVMLDIRLPDMEGWEFLDRLEKEGPFPQLPVVMVSAHATPTTAHRALERGVRAYLVKPFTREELFEVVTRIVGPPGAGA